MPAADAGRAVIGAEVVTAAGVDEAEVLAADALGRTAGATGFRVLDEHDRPVAQASAAELPEAASRQEWPSRRAESAKVSLGSPAAPCNIFVYTL